MATRGRTLSPGGALLRSSRMFSLPPPLPKPSVPNVFESESATTFYPLSQTVTVPESFRGRGDWGFKRNFPLKSTAHTSTPYLRINQVDTIEHITDYASAADLTLTLEKFHEMNLAISVPQAQHAVGVNTTKESSLAYQLAPSVFEDKFDFTAIDQDKIDKAGHMRWKFKGPWLANLSEGEFQKFLKKSVKGRRTEFREFIRAHLAPKLTAKARREAMEKGADQAILEMRPEDVTDEDILEFLRYAREQRAELYGLVSKFLDLAPLQPKSQLETSLDALKPNVPTRVGPRNPYALEGPPTTHPSAGISYLRTNSFLENHPVYGPQKNRRAVKGRVMTLGDKGPSTMFSVGGFVSPSQLLASTFKDYNNKTHPLDVPGGAKTWVTPTSAYVSSTGRIIVNVADARGEDKLVQEETQGEKQLFRAQPQVVESQDLWIRDKRGPRPSRMMEKYNTHRNGSRVSYGMEG